MSDIIKLVDRGVPPLERSQNFTSADASAGDVILIEASLGKPARSMLVEAGAAMTFRVNTRRTIFPPRDLNDGYTDLYQSQTPNIAKGQTIEDDSGALISLATNETFEMKGPIKDIKLVTAAGAFDILVL